MTETLILEADPRMRPTLFFLSFTQSPTVEIIERIMKHKTGIEALYLSCGTNPLLLVLNSNYKDRIRFEREAGGIFVRKESRSI